MDIGELKFLGLSIVRFETFPGGRSGIVKMTHQEIIDWFKSKSDLRIELRPLVLPEWLYVYLQQSILVGSEKSLLDEIQQYYGRITYLEDTIIIK